MSEIEYYRKLQHLLCTDIKFNKNNTYSRLYLFNLMFILDKILYLLKEITEFNFIN